mmetsp:Transcript_19534/g.14243  ORF Transcript_19534/g.14243 Transcript_19534/m.14243 type:complete len:81 (-) Transcript_19534:216-458(-)
MLVSNYDKTINLLMSRGEKFMLVQALHELGNLLYVCKKPDPNEPIDENRRVEDAETRWNECVDTIFQNLHVLQNFRQVFE